MIVVKKFDCVNSGPDCPSLGFKVVKSTHKEIAREGECLLGDDIKRIKLSHTVVVVPGR